MMMESFEYASGWQYWVTWQIHRCML